MEIKMHVNKKTKVFTRLTTNFVEWKHLCSKEFAKHGIDPIDPGHLRMLHAWEGGDTPYAWVDFLIRQDALKKRNANIRRDNPANY
jgi:hypothetical protein